MSAGGGVDGRCADGDRAHGDGLLAVGEIAVRGYFDAILQKRLEDDEVGVLGDRRGVEGEGHVCVPVVILGSELKLGGDFFLIHEERLSGGFVHEGSPKQIGLFGF